MAALQQQLVIQLLGQTELSVIQLEGAPFVIKNFECVSMALQKEL